LDIQEKVPTANYFELVRHVHAAESEVGDQFNFGPSQIQVISKYGWRRGKTILFYGCVNESIAVVVYLEKLFQFWP
jgi:hypothetical protein